MPRTVSTHILSLCPCHGTYLGDSCFLIAQAEKKWKAKRWRVAFGKEGDGECFFSGMMWADNYWIFSDDKEKLTCMINDIIEEFLDLDLEPKAESLWWMSTYKEEDKSTLKMGSEGKVGICRSSWRWIFSAFSEDWERGSGDGNDFEKWNGMLVAGWVHIYRAKSVPLRRILQYGETNPN